MDEDLKKNIIKTGTTTIGLVTSEGIILAADKRGTYGGDGGVSYIAGWKQKKIHQVNSNILVTVAGVASDTRKVIAFTRAGLKLKELKDKRKPSIKEAAGLFSNIVYQNIRRPSIIIAITHFLLAGFNKEKTKLYEIHADGLLDEVDDYAVSGSGLMQVNPILDSEYKKGLTIQEGIKLAKKCIMASMRRDPGSGEGAEIYTITKEKGIQKVLDEDIEYNFKKNYN